MPGGKEAFSCKAENVCRTCSTFTSMGGACVEVDKYPNVTVEEFGSIVGADDMMKEIYARGPIACSVDAEPLHNYTGGSNMTLPGSVILCRPEFDRANVP